MDLANVGDRLAVVNAALNATSAVALITGFVLIRRKTVRGHQRAMLTAVSFTVRAPMSRPIGLRIASSVVSSRPRAARRAGT